MFPAKAHRSTLYDFKSANVGVDAACLRQAKEGLPLFMGMPLVKSPTNAIDLSRRSSNQLIEKHYPALVEQLDAQGKSLPLRQWVISFSFPLRFLFAAHPQAMSKVLGIIYRAISTHLIHKAGYSLKKGPTGAVTPARPG